ncbi:MAG: ABC transporter ATP-binding protein, partial [Verrucomicrobia bacterium]|nr:ABC transporter ATP-binding protein [Verrucomicrobiota bacterium]
MSAAPPTKPPLPHSIDKLGSARESITYFRPMEEREADHAPFSVHLIRRMFTYTRRHAARRNWLFVLTFARGLQLPALAWMIGQTINGPIAGRDLPGIYLHAGIYLVLVLLMV